jgi:hypothetical protein
MSMSVKFFMSLAAASMLSASPWASAVDRPNNQKIDPKDPVVMCQKDCQREKSNEAYESCMLKCNELGKQPIPTPTVPNQKK